MMGNNQNLFFSQEEKGRAFSDVLKEVQEYISSKYSTLMVEGGNDEVKQQVKRYISKYIADYRITVKGKTREELINDLYTEMAEFSFLTKYIFGTGIEEIDINSWKDIEVQYSDGRCEKMEEHFESPEHAINVIRRMLHVSGMVLDNASPAVLGHLSKNIRIAVLKTPLVDEDVGIAASIRIVNPQSLKKSDFVDGGTATDEMLDFLAECLRYGISICVAGATSSGKTTLAGWLLTTIPDNKRIFTIENGSRELALVREKDGKVTNSVIHTLTRFSENEKQNIDQDMLLDMALRFNPEIICVGEMRSSEAYTAQESARTGHTVLTTIHSNSCESTATATTIKSGYGVNISVNASASTGQSSATTPPQTAVSYFPEFYYKTYWRLLDRTRSGYHAGFEFRNNHYSTYNRRTHFTPVWMPNGTYTVYTYLLDCWTPDGMLSVNLTDSVQISGDLWDDWHIAPQRAR